MTEEEKIDKEKEKVNEEEIKVEEEKEKTEIRSLTKEERINERVEAEIKQKLAVWKPKTKLGIDVREGKIKDIDEIFDKGLKIFEAEIVDSLIHLNFVLVRIGQSKGKFGGGKRREWRQTQKKTAEGNVPSFGALAIVGDNAGHVGVGYGKAKETVPARKKSIRNAKLNLSRVKRGCGSFDCGCTEPHSIPYSVSGKVGSVVIKLKPAPKGTGLVCDDECKKIFKLVGIRDIYSRSFGQTRTKFNMIMACISALRKIK